jgi:molecular chaperone DnaK (HSP70)
MFYTMSKGQTEVDINITQGEDIAPEYVNKIAQHKLKLPPDRPAERPVKVTYSYDVNQRMHCKFEDIESGGALEVDLCLDKDGRMSESDTKQESAQLDHVKVE